MGRSTISRRSILASGVALAALPRAVRAEDPPPTVLRIERRVISVNGKPANVLGLRQPNGTHGLMLPPGQRFRVKLENRIDGPSIIHWHGQTPPYGQDGVADAAEAALKPGEDRLYDFVPRSGTHWMHSHHGLQEQALLAAPLIVQDAEAARQDAQDVVVLLRDFTWKDADTVLAGLRNGGHSHGGHAGHGAPSANLNDVAFDAYLANDRALDDPEVFRTEPGGMVRLRLVNAATATQFWIDLGEAGGQLVAVDGNPVVPITGRKFPMATAQRMDILVRMPRQGALPVFAQVEGLRARTGFVLATPGAEIVRLAPSASGAAPAVDLSLEERLRSPLPRPDAEPTATHTLMLTGGMHGYDWGINDAPWGQHAKLAAQPGQLLRIDMANRTPMAHPMHLHGHHFRVVGLNGRPVDGAIRDTVLVPPSGARVSVEVLADNPGNWLLHCHNLYHMAAGMMTELVYPPA